MNLQPSLSTLMQLRPVLYNWNSETGTTSPQHVGFIAQEVQQVAPDLIHADMYGMLGMDYAGLTPYLTSGIQEITMRLEGIASTTSTTTPDSLNFISSFWSSVFLHLTQWFANAANGIDKLFAKGIHAQNIIANEIDASKLCAKKSDGGYVCVTSDQLASLLSGVAAPINPPAASNTPANGTAATASLTINGNDPATWQMNTPWSDNLGALFSHNGINETIYSTSTVDTSTTGTTTIDYWATWYSDPSATSSAQTLHATRQVVVIDPFASATSASSTTP
jgi:hypothetical protein